MLKSVKRSVGGRRVAWSRLFRLALDVLFTFALPYALLNPAPFGLPDLSRSLGNYGVYVLAGVLPTLYIVLDTMHRRVLNPFGLFLLAGALSGAAVSFLKLDGVAFALKDAMHSALLMLACGVSLLLRRPLFEFLFYGLVSPETPKRKQQLGAALSQPQVRRALGWATALVALKAVMLGTVSYLVALWLVTLPFGVAGFNAQVARAHALTFPAAIGLDILFYGAAGWLTLRATRRLTGGRAWPWQEGFWHDLERSTQLERQGAELSER
ncbi:hypothetical protein FNU79_13160 [Deinococcus detaillensis]|uniref:MFS transporter n=1 Tax=Deinococcus detaillensis TaxID=2592048 RepID=A0A553US61_9DEIO|nr:VC0807 family protein [Deinococcus detaillensis]TSA83058.1 hypothetical protein FNU79_13160 [Deinococcus detaillensis]